MGRVCDWSKFGEPCCCNLSSKRHAGCRADGTVAMYKEKHGITGFDESKPHCGHMWHACPSKAWSAAAHAERLVAIARVCHGPQNAHSGCDALVKKHTATKLSLSKSAGRHQHDGAGWVAARLQGSVSDELLRGPTAAWPAGGWGAPAGVGAGHAQLLVQAGWFVKEFKAPISICGCHCRRDELAITGGGTLARAAGAAPGATAWPRSQADIQSWPGELSLSEKSARGRPRDLSGRAPEFVIGRVDSQHEIERAERATAAATTGAAHSSYVADLLSVIAEKEKQIGVLEHRVDSVQGELTELGTGSAELASRVVGLQRGLDELQSSSQRASSEAAQEFARLRAMMLAMERSQGRAAQASKWASLRRPYLAVMRSHVDQSEVEFDLGLIRRICSAAGDNDEWERVCGAAMTWRDSRKDGKCAARARVILIAAPPF